MPKRSRTGKPDVNQMASNLIDAISGDLPAEQPESGKNPAAVALGRLGGLKGGTARAKSLSARKRSEIAKKAAQRRWADTRKRSAVAIEAQKSSLGAAKSRRVIRVDPEE